MTPTQWLAALIAGVVVLTIGLVADGLWLTLLGAGFVLGCGFLRLLGHPRMRFLERQPWWLGIAVALVGVVLQNRVLVGTGYGAVILLWLDTVFRNRNERKGAPPPTD